MFMLNIAHLYSHLSPVILYFFIVKKSYEKDKTYCIPSKTK